MLPVLTVERDVGAINGTIQLIQHCLVLEFGTEKGKRLNTSDKCQTKGDHTGPRLPSPSSRKEACLLRSS